MPQVIFLDTGPLSLATKRRGQSREADDCRQWVINLMLAGRRIIVPEIADYEVRRELIRAGQTAGLARLDAFNTAQPDRYLPITTDAMRRAANLWAQARNAGYATADPHALDCDVILAAQALTWCDAIGLPPSEVVVASVNVRHIARFIAADLWENITP